MQQTTLRPHQSEAIRAARLHGIPVVLLALLLALGSGMPPARAATSDEKLLSITKTTIYGALLGGLLGLATTLIVDEDHRDNAVRWGVTLGTFGGFAYGVATSDEDDDFDDFSLRPPGLRPRAGGSSACRAEGSRRLGGLSNMHNVHRLDRERLLSGIEVRNGDLEKEDGSEETDPGE